VVIGVPVVTHCNLSCRGCCHYAPVALELYLDKGALLNDLSCLEGVTKVRFLGGEPALHPDLEGLIAVAESRGLDFEIVTNGTVYNPAIERRLDKARISVYPGVSRVYPEPYRASVRVPLWRSHRLSLVPGDGEANWTACTLRQHTECLQLSNGKLYQCPVCAYSPFLVSYFNVKSGLALVPSDVFDLYSGNCLEEWLVAPKDFCKYCVENEVSTWLQKTPELADWIV
jgi:hypothetical protein